MTRPTSQRDAAPPGPSTPTPGAADGGPAPRGARARSLRTRSSRSYATIVRANVLTVFNAILAAFGIVTLIFGDWRDALFVGLIVANSGIGITQEVRAKRALDRLALIVTPHARVRRDGAEHLVQVDELVVGDLVAVQPGDQIVADGLLVTANELNLDEAILSGESETVPHRTGDQVRSGAFVSEGTGVYKVTAVGPESFAEQLTGEARSFRHPRSPLERSINRLLYVLVLLVVALGALLSYSLYRHHADVHTAVATSAAGVVALIPEGLVLLVGLTYAVAAVRMSRRGVLAQQLNAIESLASVDTVCIDKTGTLTEPAARVLEFIPAPGVDEAALRAELGGLAASATARNATLEAVANACPAEAQAVVGEAPFSSRRRWSAVAFADHTLYLGAPEAMPVGALAGTATRRQAEGRRVLALARSHMPLPSEARAVPPSQLQVLGLIVLAEDLRPGVREAVAYLQGEGIEIKVLSGDDPATAAAIARDVGIVVNEVHHGDELPADAPGRAEFATAATVVGRISPEGKRAMVDALTGQGRYVAMVGDGVNDVPAMKRARLAIAQGGGTQMARSVADLVITSGEFAALPAVVAEGRRALRNLQRVAKLYVTKSAFAACVILTIGISGEAFPLLPRHLTLAAAVSIGIPTFFLALAPSEGPWRPDDFVREVARFAVPAGMLVAAGVLFGYLFARDGLAMSVEDARTVAVSILVACGLYLVIALEAEGSRTRTTVVTVMCAALGAAYVACVLVQPVRRFFAISSPSADIILTAAVASAVAIAALWMAGFTVRNPPTKSSRGPVG